MRRMRDLSIGYYIAAGVPVLAAAFGIHHWVGQSGAGTGSEVAVVIKPSQYRLETTLASRTIASVKGDRAGEKSPRASARTNDSHAVVSEAADDRVEGLADSANESESEADAEQPSAKLQGAANDAVASGAECAQIEYRGEGPVLTKVTKGQWITVMDQFHAAKHDLLGWLEKHRKQLSESAAQAMDHQVRNLKIQRPPASDEPDLAWRGIGIYSQNAEGEPIVKLGGGFVHLAASHPARARFEMARLVAQSWAPCELQRITALDTTWSPLLKCLGLSETQGCGQGTYSESGWAVSTTVAAIVRPPGCQIPALQGGEAGKCASAIPLAKVASAQTDGARAISSVTSNSNLGGRQ